MVNYITYQRILNLYSFYILIKNWQTHTVDYLREKYDRIFDVLPDNVIFDDIENESIKGINPSYLQGFNVSYLSYIKKWNYKNELTTDDKELLFMCYYFDNIFHETPNHLIKKYSQLFTSFKHIKNHKINGLLHTKYDWLVVSYSHQHKDELKQYKRLEQIKKLKNIINA